LADVADDGREQAVLRRDAAQCYLDGQLAAVGRLRGALERRAREGGKPHVDVALESRDELGELRVEQRGVNAAEDARRRRVRRADRSLRVDTDDGVGRRVDDAAQQRVAALDAERK